MSEHRYIKEVDSGHGLGSACDHKNHFNYVI